MDFVPIDGCSCPDCTAARKPEPEPCEGCRAKDKTITELIAALSLAREREPVIFPVWPAQHPYPPSVPSVSPYFPVPPAIPTVWPFPQAPYTVTCQN